MERQHILFSWRIGSTRNVLAFSLLLVAELGCATSSRAQSEGLDVLRVMDANEIGGGLRARIAALPSARAPKVEPAASVAIQTQQQIQIANERKHRFYWLDRAALSYGLT